MIINKIITDVCTFKKFFKKLKQINYKNILENEYHPPSLFSQPPYYGKY